MKNLYLGGACAFRSNVVPSTGCCWTPKSSDMLPSNSQEYYSTPVHNWLQHPKFDSMSTITDSHLLVINSSSQHNHRFTGQFRVYPLQFLRRKKRGRSKLKWLIRPETGTGGYFRRPGTRSSIIDHEVKALPRCLWSICDDSDRQKSASARLVLIRS